MSMRRMIGFVIFAMIVIAAIFLIWYIGSQKTVYSLVAPYQMWVWRG